MTHIYKTHTVKVIVSLVLLNSLGLVKRGKKVIFKKKNFKNLSIFSSKFRGISLVGALGDSLS